MDGDSSSEPRWFGGVDRHCLLYHHWIQFAANEYKSSTRATEITRKISKHHLPDISAISREERKARGKKPLSGIDTSQREEGRPPRMNKRQLPEKKKEKGKEGINEIKKEPATPTEEDKNKINNTTYRGEWKLKKGTLPTEKINKKRQPPRKTQTKQRKMSPSEK